jgi:hypothetical protein
MGMGARWVPRSHLLDCEWMACPGVVLDPTFEVWERSGFAFGYAVTNYDLSPRLRS